MACCQNINLPYDMPCKQEYMPVLWPVHFLGFCGQQNGHFNVVLDVVHFINEIC